MNFRLPLQAILVSLFIFSGASAIPVWNPIHTGLETGLSQARGAKPEGKGLQVKLHFEFGKFGLVSYSAKRPSTRAHYGFDFKSSPPLSSIATAGLGFLHDEEDNGNLPDDSCFAEGGIIDAYNARIQVAGNQPPAVPEPSTLISMALLALLIFIPKAWASQVKGLFSGLK